MKNKYARILLAMLLKGSIAFAQIPVELFTGNKKASIDIMFFRYFKDKEGKTSRFLFFNRNRASADYKMTGSTNLPQFGFTEAISFNHPGLIGMAPVLVAQVFGSGIFAKAGMQYARIEKNATLFSWLVCETKERPNIDFFFLGRYTPKLTDKVQLFSQLELVNAAPTVGLKSFSFTQRMRLGLKWREFQFGFGADVMETGRTEWITTYNVGTFLRYEY